MGVIVAVLAFGFAITAVVTWTSWILNKHNEDHLLNLQTEQAGDVLLASVPATEAPLATAVDIAAATKGDAGAFARFMAPYLGPTATFADASLWQMTGSRLREVAVVGRGPAFARPAQVSNWVAGAFKSSSFVADTIYKGSRERLVFALGFAGQPGDFAVYAEHAIPADRRSSVAHNSAFSDLNYAIYLGHSESQVNLLTTSFSHLPPSGPTSHVSVPLGNTVLTLLTAPRGELGGTLPGRLPWIFGILGVLLSLATAGTAERVVRRRRSAERDAGEIRRLYGELGALYGEQRTIAETLQRALLPKDTPEIDGLELAVHYAPGAKGMEIGGDWYSIVAVDDERFGFVVGDVSGRGLRAATVMAGLRFTIRTYLLEGYSPSAILDKCAKQLHVLSDGHFATVLVGTGEVDGHELTIANAGHFNPLIVDGQSTSFLATVVGVPLGVSGGTYESVTVPVAPRATLLAFTDGLVESRGESIDDGLKRLEEATRGTQSQQLAQLLMNVVTKLTADASEDDVAMLGIRWQS
jgi:serine phosphatase RsbU (regulator of sigma subunit)